MNAANVYEKLRLKYNHYKGNLVISILFLLQFFILVAFVPYTNFPDNDDNLTGACLISQGKHIYSDFFVHHSPFIFEFVGAIYSLTGKCDYYLPRYVFFIIFCTSIWLLYYYSKSAKLAIGTTLTYLVLVGRYNTLMILDESWLAIITVYAFLLLFFHKKIPTPLFFILYILVAISYGANPLFLPCGIALFVYFYLEKRYNKLLLFSPFIILLILMIILVPINGYIQDFFIFNVQYYSHYGNFFSQYEYFLNIPKILSPAIGVRDKIAISGEFLLLCYYFFLIFKKKESIRKAEWVVIFVMSLNFILHIGGSHFLPILFLMTLVLLYFFTNTLKQKLLLIMLAIFFLTAGIADYRTLYRKPLDNPKIATMTNFVKRNSKTGDTILAYPLYPIVYFITDRKPGSYFYYYVPWVYDRPGFFSKLTNDIKSNKVKIVLIDDDGKRYNEELLIFLNKDRLYHATLIYPNIMAYVRK